MKPASYASGTPIAKQPLPQQELVTVKGWRSSVIKEQLLAPRAKVPFVPLTAPEYTVLSTVGNS